MQKKKVVFIIALAAIFSLAASFQLVLAGQKAVKLKVPGCVWPGTAARVGSILKGVNGVADYETDTKNNTATVRFDDEKTDVAAIKKALADGGFPVEGEAQFLN